MLPLRHRKQFFNRTAKWFARVAGEPAAFALACGLLVFWGLTGPFFHFSDTWQLVINTLTTIITFLMVFLIQNTQNRDTEALQLKIDELVRCHNGAHNALLDIEELSEPELDEIRSRYQEIARAARRNLKEGRPDTQKARLPKNPPRSRAA